MRTTALLFHDVVTDHRYETSGFRSPDADIYKLDVTDFEAHLAAIETAAQGSGVVTADGLAGEGRHLLLTFDDGGASAISHTAGMLEKRGWRGHFFMTTDYIGQRGFLGEEDLRALRRRGHVIGSHSCSHPPRMAACSREELVQEWSRSRARLEEILEAPVTTASVPGGYFNRKVAETAAASGIRVLFNSEPTTRTGLVDGCLVVGRFGIQQGVSPEWVAGVVADRALPKAARYLSWNGKKLLKAAGGTVWLAARKRILASRAEQQRGNSRP